MGTLDDAIREHLKLKQRSGASEEEVQRLEHEAFGPIRRDPVSAEGDEDATAPSDPSTPPEPPASGEEPPAADAGPSPVFGEEPAQEPSAEIPPLTPGLDPFAPPPPPPPPPPSAAAPATSPSWLEEDDDDDPPTQPTSEFTAAEAADAQSAPASDYVAPDEEGEDLEETPDFLQETPEHDRLWFEQRPPRDFDFDQ